MIEQLDKKGIDSINKKGRLCHINKFGTESAFCGLVKYTPLTQHSKEFCKKNHTMCVVCLSEYERLRGRSYFD